MDEYKCIYIYIYIYISTILRCARQPEVHVRGVKILARGGRFGLWRAHCLRMYTRGERGGEIPNGVHAHVYDGMQLMVMVCGSTWHYMMHPTMQYIACTMRCDMSYVLLRHV